MVLIHLFSFFRFPSTRITPGESLVLFSSFLLCVFCFLFVCFCFLLFGELFWAVIFDAKLTYFE